MAIDDERRHLGRTVDTLRAQLDEARGVSHAQAMRLRDLEMGLRAEEERTHTLGRQLEETHRHLFALKGQMRERARGIMRDCEVLLDVAAEAPPRAGGAGPMDAIDSMGSVGDFR